MNQINQPDESIPAIQPLAIQKEQSVQWIEQVTSPAADNSDLTNRQYIWHLAAIVESSQDAIISKSMTGIIRSWNKGSEKMFGYTSVEAIGKNISLIIPPGYVDEENNILARIGN